MILNIYFLVFSCTIVQSYSYHAPPQKQTASVPKRKERSWSHSKNSFFKVEELLYHRAIGHCSRNHRRKKTVSNYRKHGAANSSQTDRVIKLNVRTTAKQFNVSELLVPFPPLNFCPGPLSATASSKALDVWALLAGCCSVFCCCWCWWWCLCPPPFTRYSAASTTTAASTAAAALPPRSVLRVEIDRLAEDVLGSKYSNKNATQQSQGE